MIEGLSRIRLISPEGTAAPPASREVQPLPASPRVPGCQLGVQRHVHGEEALRPGDGEVLLPQSIYKKVMDHLSSDTSRELGGLLVGRVIPDGNGPPAIVIEDAIAARHTRSSGTRLTFSEETWADFDQELYEREGRRPDLQRVGWYHSHPGMRIFLSHWDLDVCLEFRRPNQVALVIDPVTPKGGFFVKGTTGFRTHSPQGFWEVKDLAPESLVQWRDLSPQLGLPPSALGWVASSPPPAADADAPPAIQILSQDACAPPGLPAIGPAEVGEPAAAEPGSPRDPFPPPAAADGGGRRDPLPPPEPSTAQGQLRPGPSSPPAGTPDAAQSRPPSAPDRTATQAAAEGREGAAAARPGDPEARSSQAGGSGLKTVVLLLAGALLALVLSEGARQGSEAAMSPRATELAQVASGLGQVAQEVQDLRQSVDRLRTALADRAPASLPSAPSAPSAASAAGTTRTPARTGAKD